MILERSIVFLEYFMGKLIFGWGFLMFCLDNIVEYCMFVSCRQYLMKIPYDRYFRRIL